MLNSEEEKDIRDIFPDRWQHEEFPKDMTVKNDFWVENKRFFVDSIERQNRKKKSLRVPFFLSASKE